MQFDLPQVISLASAIGTVMASFLIIFQIRSFEAWNRRQISNQILNDFVSGTIEDTLEAIESKFGWDLLHDGRSYREVVSGFEYDTAERDGMELDRYLRRILRRFEAICISMDHKIVQEKTCKEYIFSLLTVIHNSAVEFIEKARALRKEPRVFEHVERYANKWSRDAARNY